MYAIAKKLPSVEILNELLKVDPSSFPGLTWKVERRGTAKAGTKAGSKLLCKGVPYLRVRINGVD